MVGILVVVFAILLFWQRERRRSLGRWIVPWRVFQKKRRLGWVGYPLPKSECAVQDPLLQSPSAGWDLGRRVWGKRDRVGGWRGLHLEKHFPMLIFLSFLVVFCLLCFVF